MNRIFYRLFYIPLGYFIFTLLFFLVYAEFHPATTMEAMRITEFLVFLGPGLLIAAFFAWRIGRSISRQFRDLTRRLNDFPRIRDVPVMSGIQEYQLLARTLQDFMIRIRSEQGALRLEKELLRSLLGAFQEGVFCLDREGKIIYLNPALSEKLVSADSQDKPYFRTVRNASVLEFVHGVMKTGGQVHALDGNGPAGGPTESEPAENERDHAGEQAANGNVPPLEETSTRFQAGERFFKINYYPVQLHAEETELFLFIVQDETRQRNVTRLRQEFLQNASHELKTPVTSIRGYAESMAPRVTDGQHKNFLKAILRNALRMQHIIEDMVTISSVESGEYPLNRKTVEARKYMEGIRELVAGSLAKKQQRLEMDCPADIEINADLLLLEHLLLNLIVNASRYSPESSLIRVTVTAEEGRLLFRVIDQGPGIPPNHRKKIFERFYRIDHNRSRREGGTGLGLSIVRHVARVHSGEVWVADAPDGGGAAFHFRLPLPA